MSRKPKVVEQGKCYRLRRFPCFGITEPSETVVYVYAIEGEKQRTIKLRVVAGEIDPGFSETSYTDFLRRVHSEAPTVMQ